MKLTWKFSLSSLKAPTPAAISRFGNAMWVASTAIAAPSIMADKMWFGILIFILGAGGKFLSSFFTIENQTNETSSATTTAVPDELHSDEKA